ncbi:MAG TPA: aminoacetone oxidase family FAD-binding enzyme, partial [Thermodesulfovibrionales bacterium]|nr:aminoacetone oxidase family FAD-binding enzyme [Thermodesulfovibrionales bacterium]
MHADVIIIGAGASGLICAIEAGKRGRTVLVIDHAPKTAAKIRISGGGACNFTNLRVSADDYISMNPHFCKSALSRYTPNDIISSMQRAGIPFHEKEDGRLFCDAPASRVVQAVESECRSRGVDIRLNCPVTRITKEGDFIIATRQGVHSSRSLVIATGGLSWPKIGASGLGMSIAAQFGIRVVPAKPGLVPLIVSRKDRGFFKDLSGISFPASVSCGTASFRGSVLFTHRGLSGPAILQASSYWNPGNAIFLNLLPGIDAHNLLLQNRRSKKVIGNFLSQYLPSRFIRAWCDRYLQQAPLCRLTEKELEEAACKIGSWQVMPAGTEGYDVAEVTVGG